MMNNSIVAGLVVVLAVTVLVAGMWNLLLIKHSARSSDIQHRLTEIQNANNVINAIANEAVEYSKRNPAILPVLKPFNLPASAPAGPTPAAAKPSAKNGAKSAK
jgi:type II secretory pathway component PulM